MIPKTFVAPNFRCRIRRESVPAQWRLFQAESEVELRERLEVDGWEVLKVNAYNFEDWKEKARKETERAVKAKAAGQPYEFKESIWGELKEYLFHFFNGKCAYCEGPRGAVTPGAVEHYRPKTGVQEDKDHPGYYWLAYDHTNYVPVCSDCNSKKGTRFPIAPTGHRARKPGDSLESELALLLNPYEGHAAGTEFDYAVTWEPDSFYARLIFARPKSPRAEKTIEVVGLNRDRLPEERALAQKRAMQALQIQLAVRPNPVLQGIKAGRAEYSAACLAAIEHALKELW